MKGSRVGSWVGTSVFLILLYGAFLNRRWLIDEYNVLTLQAGEVIASIASQDKLTDTGTRYFYASRPQIEDRASFTKIAARMSRLSVCSAAMPGSGYTCLMLPIRNLMASSR